MHVRQQHDQAFDEFYRERKRVRAKLGPQPSALGYENRALRELEQVEAREVRDRQLTREVHEFFAAATKQAAEIVERVSHDAEVQAGQRLEQEVEAFLIDSLARMNTFIVSVMQQRRYANVAETQVEPSLGHLVGPGLDEFRWAGTADIGDKHIGQDPFATPVEEVQAEFRAVVGDRVAPGESAIPIENHLVAETSDEPAPDEGDADTASGLSAYAADDEPAADSGPATVAAARPAHATHSEAAAPASEGAVDVDQQLDQFKSALKALVRQGVMQREEARAAWVARLASLGRH